VIDEELTAQLAELLRFHRLSWPEGQPVLVACACGYQPSSSLDMEDHRAAALLPVVRRYGDQRAAEAIKLLEAIQIRCREGDPRSDWLPVIDRLATEAIDALCWEADPPTIVDEPNSLGQDRRA
jgi:hypothetical protein